ncbi:hypothetical protein GQ53DRAFT_820367 [Thozetella sp. PMI_491]|nr:hypothetical protein GQ53DRAFT_820367 [Thozetella sp. PMI_491]
MLTNENAYGLLGFLLAVSWLFFLLRLYVRFYVIKKPALDDLLIGFAMIIYGAFTGFGCGIIASGLGTDIDDDPTQTQQWSNGAFFFLFSELSFIVASGLLRVACAVMLLRLLPQSDRRLRLIIIITSSIMVLYSLAFFLVTLLQCQPVSYFWHYMEEDAVGRCINGEKLTGNYTTMSILFTVHSVVCVLNDWVLGSVPYILLKNVHMKWSKKLIVILLLSLGVLAGVTALVRAPLILKANEIEFWDAAVPVAITTAIEPALGTIAICSSALMPLFKRGSKLRGLNSKDRHPSNPEGSSFSHRMATLTHGSNKSRSARVAPASFPRGQLASTSETAIVVETSWIVDEEQEGSHDAVNSNGIKLENHSGPAYRCGSNFVAV